MGLIRSSRGHCNYREVVVLELGLRVSRYLPAGDGRGGLWAEGRGGPFRAEAAAGVEQRAVRMPGGG